MYEIDVSGEYKSVKITPPAIPDGILQRERLFSLLDKKRDKPIIWISAPGGSGKTTLLSSYLNSRGIHCLWYQVDEGDGDIGSFFYYMGMAVAKVASTKRKPMTLLSPEYSLGILTFTRRYFEDLYNRITNPCVIVLDNYQEAPEGSAFHDVISTGLSIAPEGQTVIVLSRVDPPPSFAKLKADRKIVSLGWQDTRFNLEETKEIVLSSHEGCSAKD
ncbi:MAG: hypothetical protein WCI64_10965, partial [Chlorobium sp.]